MCCATNLVQSRNGGFVYALTLFGYVQFLFQIWFVPPQQLPADFCVLAFHYRKPSSSDSQHHGWIVANRVRVAVGVCGRQHCLRRAGSPAQQSQQQHRGIGSVGIVGVAKTSAAGGDLPALRHEPLHLRRRPPHAVDLPRARREGGSGEGVARPGGNVGRPAQVRDRAGDEAKASDEEEASHGNRGRPYVPGYRHRRRGVQPRARGHVHPGHRARHRQHTGGGDLRGGARGREGLLRHLPGGGGGAVRRTVHALRAHHLRGHGEGGGPERRGSRGRRVTRTDDEGKGGGRADEERGQRGEYYRLCDAPKCDEWWS